MSAERKTSAPAAPLSLPSGADSPMDSARDSARDTSPALKLRGGAPDSNPSESKGPGRKLSGLSVADAPRQQQQRFPPTADDEEEMDHKLAQKLGISDSASDGPVSPSRTSFSYAMHPGILKHSEYLPDNQAADGHQQPAAGTPLTPGSVTSLSPTSPFSLGSATSHATSQGSEPRRKVSIAESHAPPSKKMSVASYVSCNSHQSAHHVKAAEHHHGDGRDGRPTENGKTPSIVENGIHKRRSCIEIVYNKVYPDRNIESSSWYLFCKKVRKKDEEAAADAWEPAHWQSVCPYPFCPTYRQFARLVGITLVVLLLWGAAFAVLGDTLAPGGDLFNLAVLTIAAHFGGWLMSLATMPALVGMLLVGILFQNVGLYTVSGDFVEVVSVVRKVALIIILTRAGLDLDPPALRRLLWTVLKIGLLPWLLECVVVAVTMYFFFGMPWIWGFMLGSAVAAVSPAVTVSCLFRLRARGYGTAKGIPTLIIAISGIDDAVSVAGFGIISSILFSHDSLLYQIVQGPLSVVMGLGFGVLWGILAKYVPERNDPFVVPLRVLMLFGGGLIAVLGSEAIGLGGAGPLAVVAAAFVSCYQWTQQGWEVDDNPVATAFEIFWMVFEPILFGLTGTMIKIDQLEPHVVGMVAGCLCIGFALRIVSTIPISYRSGLNTKEKVFVSLSLMAKATVQAALCTVPLDVIRESTDETTTSKESTELAHLFLTVCVVSILMTAPTIAILMTLLGPRLLTKTTVDPEFPENWRRHTRPSLRDISIINEGDEDDDDLGKLSRRSSRRTSASIKDSHSAKYDARSDVTPAAAAATPAPLTTTAVP